MFKTHLHRFPPIAVAACSRAQVCGLSPAGVVGSNLWIPVPERSKTRVCGPSLTGVVGSSPTGGMDVCGASYPLRKKGKSQDNPDKKMYG